MLHMSNKFFTYIAAGSLSLCLMTSAFANDRPSAVEASEFLQSASFGPTQESIDDVVQRGYSNWFRRQQRLPINTILSETNPTFRDRTNRLWESVPRSIWYDRAVFGEDQLRQRAAFALSQIFVVSTAPRDLAFKSHLHARYMDIMQEGAFGNFRDLLEEVTYSGLMGEWLTYIGNEPADPATGAMPDENYAREIMQLFTIGLVELNQNGTTRGNTPIETYTQTDVSELSKVFTGLWWADRPFGEDPRGINPRIAERSVDIQRMVMHNEFHDRTRKNFLGASLPGGARGNRSIRLALDHLFEHRNVAPFITKQLIQRMTTSNPSNSYVRRVADTFDSGRYTLPDGSQVGNGERGDMTAVFAAILFDPHARRASRLDDPTYGKVREPLIRFLHWARASDINRVRVLGDDNFRNGGTDAIGQTPFRSLSVFNFFRPGFVASGTNTANQGLVAPELQIINTATAINYPNFMEDHVMRDDGDNWVGSYEDQLAFAGNTDALLDHIDLTMTSGRMTNRTRNFIRAAVDDVEVRGNQARRNEALRNRVQIAMLLVVNSQEYNTQQ